MPHLSETPDKPTANPHHYRYDRLNLPRERREEIGFKVKRLLDVARREFARSELGLDARLVYYCDKEVSPENVALLAKKK